MRKWLILLLILALPAMAAADTIMWTESDGYRYIATNDRGEGMYLRQALEEEDGLVENVGASFTLIPEVDSGNEPRWNKTLSGDGTDRLEQVIATEDGWLAVGSSSSSDIGTDWHEGVYDSKEGKTDGWIVRTDHDGNTIWMKVYGGTDWDSFYSVCPAWDGGWIVCGNTYSSDGDVEGWHDSGEMFIQPDGWLLHIGEDGEIIWQATLGGAGYDELLGVAQVPGGYMAVGMTDSTDGDVVDNKGGRDGWMVIVDTEGKLQQQRCFGGTNDDEFLTLAKGPDGYLAVGTSWSTPSKESETNDDGWAVLLDEKGTTRWGISFGGDGFAYPHRALWMQNVWVLAGSTWHGAEEHTWLIALRPDGGAWELVRGQL